ncbi:hypothetical protein ACIRL2_50335 [Embleya sp. NPDC127516]|uniref:hypothetical protein n=1 Tax=Embleya sp. NPDC127516 TaxID=3363990 RepID=UPI0037FB6BB8
MDRGGTGAAQRDVAGMALTSALCVAVACFLACAAAIGFSVGSRFLGEDLVVAALYASFVAGVGTFPLGLWQVHSGVHGRRGAPRLGSSPWRFGAFFVANGVIAGRLRGEAPIALLIVGAAGLWVAGITSVYLLGGRWWGRDDDVLSEP